MERETLGQHPSQRSWTTRVTPIRGQRTTARRYYPVSADLRRQMLPSRTKRQRRRRYRSQLRLSGRFFRRANRSSSRSRGRLQCPAPCLRRRLLRRGGRHCAPPEIRRLKHRAEHPFRRRPNQPLLRRPIPRRTHPVPAPPQTGLCRRQQTMTATKKLLCQEQLAHRQQLACLQLLLQT